MHLFLKKIYRKNPFPKIYRINQCEVLIYPPAIKDNANIKLLITSYETVVGIIVTVRIFFFDKITTYIFKI